MSKRKSEREERLAAALRENLKRRKAQARVMDKGNSSPAKGPRQSRTSMGPKAGGQSGEAD